MASELSWRGTATGNTDYATIRSAARQMWSTAGSPALENLTVANWANYAISLSESPASSYFYVGNWPAGLTTAGWYWVDVYKQVGGSPAISDTFLGTLIGWWNGTVFTPWSGDAASVGGTTQTARDLGASVLLAAGQKVDVDTIKTQAITCSAGVTVNPQVGSAYELSVASGGKAAATVASGDDADAASIWALVKAGGAGDLAALVTAVGGLVTTIGAACAGVATAIWSAATRTLTAGAFSGTPQTGDSYAVVKSGGTGDLVALKAVTPISVIAAKTDLPAAPNNPTLGTDGKVLVSTDAQDLSGTLSVNAKKLNGATPNNVAATDIVTGGAITTSGGKVSEVATVDAVPAVTLAATQGSYAPAKAGDAMALTSGERTTLAGVIWALATSGMSTVGSIGKKLADWVLGTSQTADVGTLITTVGAAGAGLTALPAVTLAASQPNFAPAKVTDLGTVQTGDTYAIAKSGGGGDLAAIKTALGSAGAGLTSLPAVTLATSQPNYAPAKVADLGTVQTGDSFAVVKSGGTGDLVALKTVTPASAIAAKSDLPGSDVESLMEDVP